MTDKSLQQAVLDELDWEPSVDAAHIGVTASNGVVTLTGHVPSYTQKWAAERAVGRVTGVKAVAEELEVRFPFEGKNSDDDIAKRAVQSLDWDVSVPDNKVKVKVEKGWVTLSGEVDWYFQRSAAEADVRKLQGVKGVSDEIKVKPSVNAYDVREKIKSAFDRNAQLEAANIIVTADGGKVTLSGKVDTWRDRDLAERTAWSAPGVTQVDDQLIVS
jgi:osmotically-inducible protein OsmY